MDGVRRLLAGVVCQLLVSCAPAAGAPTGWRTPTPRSACLYTTLVLVTGPIWARPIWGRVVGRGNPRLTMTVVLWAIYAS